MNPIILYKNYLANNTLTVTSEASGYSKDNLIDWRTFTKWKASSSADQNIDAFVDNDQAYLELAEGGWLETEGGFLELEDGVAPDALFILNHNLKTIGATITIQYSLDAGVSYTTIHSFVPATNKAQFVIFNLTDIIVSQYWRIKITGATAAAEIGILMLGKKLQFPWPPDNQVIPKQESMKLASEISQEGHLLGTVLAYNGIQINHKWSNLLRQWTEGTFEQFWDSHAKFIYPFVYVWDLTNRPDDIFYVRVNTDMVYQEPLSKLSYADELQLQMTGISE
ncbi:MAG TPA: hypothetical protein DCX45_03570 [Acinetobacter junii]|nr:hypothetical protein [Acinetobacter junii]